MSRSYEHKNLDANMRKYGEMLDDKAVLAANLKVARYEYEKALKECGREDDVDDITSGEVDQAEEALRKRLRYNGIEMLATLAFEEDQNGYDPQQ